MTLTHAEQDCADFVFFAASRNVMFIFFKLFQCSDGRFCTELRSFSRKLHFAIARFCCRRVIDVLFLNLSHLILEFRYFWGMFGRPGHTSHDVSRHLSHFEYFIRLLLLFHRAFLFT